MDEARDDLREIGLYIAMQSSITRAEGVVKKIAGTPDILVDHPYAGPVIEEDDSGQHRQLHCYSYRIIYRPEPEPSVIAVIHGARLLQPAILRRK